MKVCALYMVSSLETQGTFENSNLKKKFQIFSYQGSSLTQGNTRKYSYGHTFQTSQQQLHYAVNYL